MTVVVRCKRCSKELRAKDRYAGMPTRCPRCGTLNNLPSLPSKVSQKQVASKKGSGRQAKPAGKEASSDACKICGRPIRGKAERFEDVHGTVYHLGCYQKRAGEASDDACRICHKAFNDPKERVKDVLGFFYHRKCYHEELERQRLAAGGVSSRTDTASPARTPTRSKAGSRRTTDVDERDLTSDEEDDRSLTEEADDGWMRPDPSELELKEDAEPSIPAADAIPSASKPVTKPVDRSATAPAEPRLRQLKTPPTEARPLRRARPLEERPALAASGLPERLELPPNEPAGLPEGLELLPETPQPDVVEGLEILDDAPMVPIAQLVPVALTTAPRSPAAPSAPLLGGLGPLETLPSAEPVQGILLDPATGQPLVPRTRRHGSSDTIPAWLWAVMGIGGGVVVIVLILVVVFMIKMLSVGSQ